MRKINEMQITDKGLLFLINNKFLPHDKKKINPSHLKQGQRYNEAVHRIANPNG